MLRKILSLVLVTVLLLMSWLPATAEVIATQKEEVVYGLLHLDGSVAKLQVVNIFNGGTIVDYGDYSEVKNMTTTEKLSLNNQKLTLSTNVEKFSYEGTLNQNDLPWNIRIKYYMDGKELNVNNLAGKSGSLKITISVNRNNKVNSSFYDNYALQIALSLSNKLCSNIKADNATIAEAGGKKQLSFTALPGKGIDATVTADVKDFEMDPITINGIRLALGIDVDSNEFTGQISELADAIKGLDNGSSELLAGLNKLSSGMQKYMDGMKIFNDGLIQLSGGAAKLNSGAAALKKGLSQLSGQNQSLLHGAAAIQRATFDSVNAKLKEMGLELPVLTVENYNQVLTPITELAAIKEQLEGTVQFTEGLKSYINGVAQLDQGASELAKGTSEFDASASMLATSSNELYQAGLELNSGIKQLKDGLASYSKGTKQLRNGTADMDSKINEKIDDLLSGISGTGDKVISFVSEKNTNVAAVQFVLKTDSIDKPELTISFDSKEVKLTFWQKILNLFGLL